jgi:hypothetical protein
MDNKGKVWVTDPTASLEIKVGTEFPANLPPKTVMQVFQETVKAHENDVIHILI